MTKKFILPFAGVVFALLGVLCCGIFSERKPFKAISSNDVVSAQVSAFPPDVTVQIQDREAIDELVKILNTVVVYGQDDSGREYAGQLVEFKLTMKDTTTLQIGAYNPFIFINGICYKTKYKPCEALNSLGNRLIKQ